MYVTRPLSLYKDHPELLCLPPEGPAGSGYLILEDGNSNKIKDLPFPQNKLLNVTYTFGDNSSWDRTFFIPVVDQPLSLNRYYVIAAENKHKKGLAYASAREEDTEPCCFCFSFIRDRPPKGLNPHNVDQQYEIFKTQSRCFSARSVDPNFIPPAFLKTSGWEIRMSDPKSPPITEASGIDSALRSQHLDFCFPVSRERSFPVRIGKWYCPFMFVVEGTPKEQLEKTMFYELTVEQRWERIFTCEKDGDSNTVALSVVVPTEVVRISWTEAVSERDEAKGIMWFWTVNEMGLQVKIGLSLLIIERMIWEQERVGWACGNQKQLMVARVENYQGADSWEKFGCYMLVEQFVLKRLDGSLVLTYDFNHTHRIKCKWE